MQRSPCHPGRIVNRMLFKPISDRLLFFHQFTVYDVYRAGLGEGGG